MSQPLIVSKDTEVKFKEVRMPKVIQLSYDMKAQLELGVYFHSEISSIFQEPVLQAPWGQTQIALGYSLSPQAQIWAPRRTSQTLSDGPFLQMRSAEHSGPPTASLSIPGSTHSYCSPQHSIHDYAIPNKSKNYSFWKPSQVWDEFGKFGSQPAETWGIKQAHVVQVWGFF